MGYFKKAAKGVSWMTALRFATRILAYLKIGILARLLTPLEFGLFGIAVLILSLLEIITETGINVFFIQDEGKIDEYLNTAWVVSILRGIVISFTLVIFAPAIALYFKSPGALNLIYLTSLLPLIRAFINPAIVKYQKELQFNKEFILRISIFSLDALVAISLAFILKNAASMVWGMLAGAVLEVFLSHILVKPRPKLAWEKEKLKRIFVRGKWVTFSSIMQYLYTNSDSLVIGRVLSMELLGFYQMAYKISTLPITEVSDTFYKVSFPVYSLISQDKKRLLRAFWRTTLTSALIVVPLGLGIFFLSNPLIRIILGNKWLAIEPSLKILALYAILRAVVGQIPAVLLSLKRQEYVAYLSSFSVLIIALVIFPLISLWGILGAGVAVLISTCLTMPLSFYLLHLALKR